MFLHDYFGYPLENKLLVSKGNKISDQLKDNVIMQPKYDSDFNKIDSGGNKGTKGFNFGDGCIFAIITSVI